MPSCKSELKRKRKRIRFQYVLNTFSIRSQYVLNTFSIHFQYVFNTVRCKKLYKNDSVFVSFSLSHFLPFSSTLALSIRFQYVFNTFSIRFVVKNCIKIIPLFDRLLWTIFVDRIDVLETLSLFLVLFSLEVLLYLKYNLSFGSQLHLVVFLDFSFLQAERSVFRRAVYLGRTSKHLDSDRAHLACWGVDFNVRGGSKLITLVS